MWSARLTFSLLLSGVSTLASIDSSTSCFSETAEEVSNAASLLQRGNHREAADSSLAPSAGAAAQSWLKLSHVSSVLKTKQSTEEPATFIPAVPGQARAILPASLFEFGVTLLGEGTLDAVVANTNYHNVTYSGETLNMRLVNGECTPYCHFGTPEADVYGLATVNTLTPNEHGMLDMMDVGGNCGVVTVAAFKKDPKRLRIIVVEPVPSTYFLLCWNLWLNGVPQIGIQDWQANPHLAGVLAFNNGVASTNGETLGLCYTPPFTMNARICDCGAAQGGVTAQQPFVPQCANVASQSFGTLLGHVQSATKNLALLKVDCEGCELSLLPELDRMAQNPAWKIGRLAGELHGVGNTVENVACKFEGGKWVEHICNTGPPGVDTIWDSVNLIDRCPLGETRKPCSHANGREGI